MPNTVLVGAQWGDEGKGKIIDFLTEEVDMVVRYQGGNNAGHTVKIGDQTHVLHLIPSGIFREKTACVIGNGLVVDPLSLLKEIGEVEAKGMKCAGRLFLSDRAHVVFPYHNAIDAARESGCSVGQMIGTTKRGIGPSYGDKIARVGLRVADMMDPAFPELVAAHVRDANRVLAAMGAAMLDEGKIVEDYRQAAQKLIPYVTDTVGLVNEAAKAGKSILFEGAQGTMLDIDFGTYPFVTSSNASVGGVCTGAGVAPRHINRVIGVVKAYTTRVGEGPFPTELTDEIGALLRKEGHEFGATTGRPRRCGWFDAVVCRYSAMINGVDYWAMTKLDVLDSVKTIRVCVAYEVDGKRQDSIPASARVLARCRPVYEDMPGWQTSTKDVSRYSDLPAKTRVYVERLCQLTGVKLGVLSVGPRRDSTMRIAI
jgi:adenylosuccinate synthase